jgi:endonuclease I
MLYFVVRYYDRNIRDGMHYGDFWKARVPMFLAWHRQDPPDAAERARNDAIDSYQHNRNPFVDDPSLAEKVGAQVFQSH